MLHSIDASQKPQLSLPAAEIFCPIQSQPVLLGLGLNFDFFGHVCAFFCCIPLNLGVFCSMNLLAVHVSNMQHEKYREKRNFLKGDWKNVDVKSKILLHKKMKMCQVLFFAQGKEYSTLLRCRAAQFFARISKEMTSFNPES